MIRTAALSQTNQALLSGGQLARTWLVLSDQTINRLLLHRSRSL